MKGKKPEEGQEFVDQVKDTGIGIPANKQARIFDRFNRSTIPPPERRRAWVTLALTQELGEVAEWNHIRPKRAGKGSEFLMQLPVTRTATVHKSFQRQKPAEPASLMGRQIQKVERGNLPLMETAMANPALVIEDNKDVVRYLQACLEQDYSVLAATMVNRHRNGNNRHADAHHQRRDDAKGWLPNRHA